MTNNNTPSYQSLTDALLKTDLRLHASQAHGIMCGIICGNKLHTPVAWENLITGGDTVAAPTKEELHTLYNTSGQQLKEFLFDLQLLLPEDEDDLTSRAEALTLWCQGFLTGLKFINIPIVGREPSDTTEAIDDLIEIAKLNYEQVISTEEDEAAYVELVEYVRMAVILIYQNIHETTARIPSSSTDTH